MYFQVREKLWTLSKRMSSGFLSVILATKQREKKTAHSVLYKLLFPFKYEAFSYLDTHDGCGY